MADPLFPAPMTEDVPEKNPLGLSFFIHDVIGPRAEVAHDTSALVLLIIELRLVEAYSRRLVCSTATRL
jgi:hypothetical protein